MTYSSRSLHFYNRKDLKIGKGNTILRHALTLIMLYINYVIIKLIKTFQFIVLLFFVS